MRVTVDCFVYSPRAPPPPKKASYTIVCALKGRGGETQVTALKAPRMCPFVLLLKIGWKNGRATRDEEGKMVESEMCEVRISCKK